MYIMEYNGVHYQILLCVITKVMGIFLVDNYKMVTQKRTDGHSFDLFWGGGFICCCFFILEYSFKCTMFPAFRVYTTKTYLVRQQYSTNQCSDEKSINQVVFMCSCSYCPATEQCFQKIV